MENQIENPIVHQGADGLHRGPSLLALAIVHTVLFLGSVLATAAMSGGGHIPSPFVPQSGARAFFAANAAALRVNAFLQLGAAITFGLFTATAVSRLRFLGLWVAGVDIARFGGITAAAMLALSALVGWTLAESGLAASGGDVRSLHLLFFALGGPGYVAAAGLFAAGVSLSAGLTGLLPMWLMWLGLAIAALAELSTLTLLSPAAAYLLPLARFPLFVWMIGAAAVLPRFRQSRPHVRSTSGVAFRNPEAV